MAIKIQRLFVVLLSGFAGLHAFAQNDENARFSFDQSNQLLYIQYDLTGLNFRQEALVTPFIIDSSASDQNTIIRRPFDPNSKRNRDSLVKSVSGDVGWVKSGGKDKQIVWSPFNDGVVSFKGVKVGLLIEYRDIDYPSYWGTAYHASNSAFLGQKFFKLDKFGYFFAGRIGKPAPSYRYSTTNDGSINYLESGIYRVGTKRLLASYAVTGGIIYQLRRQLYTYAGIGIGAERLFWQYKAYNLDGIPTSDFWVLNEQINNKGIINDIGIIFRKGALVFDLGLSTIQYKSFQIIGGIGFAQKSRKK